MTLIVSFQNQFKQFLGPFPAFVFFENGSRVRTQAPWGLVGGGSRCHQERRAIDEVKLREESLPKLVGS